LEVVDGLAEHPWAGFEASCLLRTDYFDAPPSPGETRTVRSADGVVRALGWVPTPPAGPAVYWYTRQYLRENPWMVRINIDGSAFDERAGAWQPSPGDGMWWPRPVRDEEVPESLR
jgi:hypothetical protein